MIPTYAPSIQDWMRQVAGTLNPLLGKIADIISLRGDFNATGNGLVVDEDALLQALEYAAEKERWIDGAGFTYGVSGTFELPPVVRLRNAKIKQLDTGTSDFRPLYQSGGTLCHLVDVSVDRGTAGTAGSLTDAAGIWIDNCDEVRIATTEVTGSGYGNGIFLSDCDEVSIDRAYVHDMACGSASATIPANDVLQGICATRCNQILVSHPRVLRVTSQWSGQAAINRFTRGAVFNDCGDVDLVVPRVDTVDQGVDFTGGVNERFTVVGGSVKNAYTYGWKCANSTLRGSFHGSKAYRCGHSGFLVEATTTSPPSQSVDHFGCVSDETGYGGQWVGLAAISGFRVMSSATYTDYPRGARYHGCQAHGDGAPMDYGFYSDATLAAPNNQVINCEVSGAGTADSAGF